MGSEALTGRDTITISSGSNTRTLTDVPNGDVGVLTFPNELVTVKIGKNQNALFAKNAQGDEADFSIRIIKGSYDDKWLDSLLATMNNDFATFTTLNATLTKRIGHGDGSVTNDKYILQGGVFNKRVESKENVDGDTEQLVSIYTMKFTIPSRNIM